MTTAKDAPAEPREAVEQVSEAAAAATAGQAAMFEQALKLPQEFTRFYAQRMGRDLETFQALSRCRSPADLMTVWTEAAQAAAEDYRTEVTRVMELVTNGAAETARATNGSGRSRKK